MVLQVVMVGAVMPPANLVLTIMDYTPGGPTLWSTGERLGEYGVSTALPLRIGPWTARAALIRQKEAWARHQALAFDLERNDLEGEAENARLRLLQAQVAPHFLFNTLANIRELVAARSPLAPAVLDSLIAYFRADVPSLDETLCTLEEELRLVQAYLELMHMRMPDRLRFTLDVDETARSLQCPPLTLLTLVENAVRHGIAPSELGGRIDIAVRRSGGRCRIEVADTDMGLQATKTAGLGSGLATLRQRLLLAFGGDVELRLFGQTPQSTVAELEFPAEARPAP